MTQEPANPRPVLHPGLHYGVNEADYHSDPCILPSLSASVAKTILERSPLHAWLNHPRLGGKPEDEEEEGEEKKSPSMQFGTVGHALLLGSGKKIIVGNFPTWQSNASKEFRAAAVLSNMTPVLKHVHERAVEMRDGILKELQRLKFASMFEEAKPEVVGVALDKEAAESESGAYRRIMMDKLLLMSGGHQAVIFDPKMTPRIKMDKLNKQIGDMYYDQRAVFYQRTLATILPSCAGRIRYVFLFCETHPPYCVVPVEISGAFRAIGDTRYTRAIDLWKKCIATGKWPGYTEDIILIEPSTWQLSAEGMAEDGYAKPNKF